MIGAEEIFRHRINRLSEALQECVDELKVAEQRFAKDGQDSAAARMNVAGRAARLAICEHGKKE